MIGEADGAAATAWDTTALADGWHARTSGEHSVQLAAIDAADAAFRLSNHPGCDTVEEAYVGLRAFA